MISINIIMSVINLNLWINFQVLKSSYEHLSIFMRAAKITLQRDDKLSKSNDEYINSLDSQPRYTNRKVKITNP